MQFLKTLFWVALTVALVLFATANWRPATLTLWGGLEADIKIPVLVFIAFLLGFLPTLLFHRARMWTMRRRLDALERQAAVTMVAEPSVSTTASAAPAPVTATAEGPAAL